MEICILCGREVPELTYHHVIPKSMGGKHKELIGICDDCHRQLHTLFDNKILKNHLNTIDSILANDKFKRYLKWIVDKPFGSARKIKRSKDSRNRGRRG